jgi:hypothetical protein
LQLNGGASLQNATAGGGARFYYVNLPEGSDGEVSFPINTKYDGTGFGLKIHWFVNDASHGTNHSMEYYAKMYRDSDAMAAETARAFTMVDAATDVNYIRVISPITVEGNFTSSGTNMHLSLLHRGDCGASGDLRILCLEITYLIELE